MPTCDYKEIDVGHQQPKDSEAQNANSTKAVRELSKPT